MSKNKNQESMGEVFVISVAAELAGMHAQTLRTYDRMGLVTPQRTSGGGRRYSREDVELLRTVQRLSQEDGVNLAGIKAIIQLKKEKKNSAPNCRRLAPKTRYSNTTGIAAKSCTFPAPPR